ncbi:MAG TPA: PP2C family protein-serine/threonine phosphatase [Spirochaetota bacterium]|nr:PP2C family protein-serine/threonine phosphatase [Spirochaetota bacterium]
MSDIQYKLMKNANLSIEDIIRQYSMIEAEAEEVRNNDKLTVKNLFGSFYGKKLNVGIGFQRAYGSILSGDYFELYKLPDSNYLFVFADISGHGLPAYTTLIRLRSAITSTLKMYEKRYRNNQHFEYIDIVREIGNAFTDILDASQSKDFASVIFTFISNENDKFHLTFFSRGMHFPFIARRFENSLMDIYNLNNREKGWIPAKSHLLGSEIRDLLGEKYNKYISCHFVIYEGDSLFFFSDGLIEGTAIDNPHEEYGTERLMDCLREHIHLYPQAIVNTMYEKIYEFIGRPERQFDDMTAVLIDFPLVRAN